MTDGNGFMTWSCQNLAFKRVICEEIKHILNRDVLTLKGFIKIHLYDNVEFGE